MSEALAPRPKRRKTSDTLGDAPAAKGTAGAASEVSLRRKTSSQPGAAPSAERLDAPQPPKRITAQILQKYPDMEWISSHVDPDSIIWSSHPDVIAPDVVHVPGLNCAAEQDCANTWFVQDPVPSSATCAPSDESSALLGAAAALIDSADGILIVAGAGIGVDSGLPDYRGPSGFWKDYKGLQDLGLTLEDISHPDWFRSDPEAAWGLYGSRMRLYLEANPHRGFHILQSLARLKQNNYFVFTSNIDGQFLKSGFDEKKLFESHGTLAYMQCLEDDCPGVWRSQQLPTVKQAQVITSTGDPAIIPLALHGTLPKCPACSGLARPNVSMFGDTYLSWKSERAHEQKARMKQFLQQFSGTRRLKLVIIEIGCGTSLHSLRCDVELLLNQIESANLIRINPNEASVRESNGISSRIGLKMGGLEALLGLAQRLNISTSRPARHVSKFKLRIAPHEDYI